MWEYNFTVPPEDAGEDYIIFIIHESYRIIVL